MKLVVAEKPSVARDLARVLGARDRRDGVLQGNGYVVTACIGHLVELDEPTSYDTKWKRWAFATLPMIPETFRLRPVKRTMKAWRTVRDLLRQRDFECVINACDAGREGELIFRYVYEHANSKLPIVRLWISSLTDEAIRRGFANLRPGRDYDNLADAARARSQADWLVGLNATRAMTIAVGRHGGVHSIGRVQTPTLALIVDREAAIRKFVAQDFWEVDARIDHGAGFDARWTAPRGATRLTAESAAGELVQRVSEEAKNELLVVRVTKTAKTEAPPQLYDLTTLQRTANQRYGFSADRTLKAAQALYEKHKLITYPRTSSRYLSEDQRSGLPALVHSFDNHAAYGPHAKALGQFTVGRRIIDDNKVGDHHAIIVTSGGRRSAQLPPDDAKIYDLVVRRFLAALHPPAKLENTTIVLATAPCAPPKWDQRDQLLDKLPPSPDRFVARGQVVRSAGWHAVEPPRRREHELPAITEGTRCRAALRTKRGQTKPPPRLTDASLLAAMETAGKDIEDEELREAMKASGLGTPATRAATIETLIRREYVRREKKALAPTDKGMALIERLPFPTLKSAELTGEWEARLLRIAGGQERAASFRSDVEALVRDVVKTMKDTAPPPLDFREERPSVCIGRCPRCSANVMEMNAGFGCQKCPFNLPRYFAGRSLETSDVKALLTRGRTPKLGGFRSKKKKRFAAALVVQDGEVRFDFDKSKAKAKALPPIDVVCPGCQSQGLIAGRQAWGCQHWRDGCRFTVPYVVEGKKLTRKEIEDLVTKGKTRKAQFGSGKGRLHLEGAAYQLRIECL